MKKTYVLRTIVGAFIAVTSLTTTAFAQDHTGHKVDTYGNCIISVPKDSITKPSDEELSKIRQEMLKLVNAERAKVGASALVLDDRANQMAQDHSEDMAKNGYMGHNSPTYGDYEKRAASNDIVTDNIGEICTGIVNSSSAAIQNWMNSDEHRISMLSTNYTKIGVGYCEGYWTVSFYGPNKYEHKTYTKEQQALIDKMNANW